jgi:hypothetical protein
MGDDAHFVPGVAAEIGHQVRQVLVVVHDQDLVHFLAAEGIKLIEYKILWKIIIA